MYTKEITVHVPVTAGNCNTLADLNKTSVTESPAKANRKSRTVHEYIGCAMFAVFFAAVIVLAILKTDAMYAYAEAHPQESPFYGIMAANCETVTETPDIASA